MFIFFQCAMLLFNLTCECIMHQSRYFLSSEGPLFLGDLYKSKICLSTCCSQQSFFPSCILHCVGETYILVKHSKLTFAFTIRRGWVSFLNLNVVCDLINILNWFACGSPRKSAFQCYKHTHFMLHYLIIGPLARKQGGVTFN